MSSPIGLDVAIVAVLAGGGCQSEIVTFLKKDISKFKLDRNAGAALFHHIRTSYIIKMS